VALEVATGTPVHADTRAFLSMAGITGVRSIDLKGGSYAAPPVPQDGVIAAGLGTLDKLQAKAEMIADESGKLMLRANEIVDGAQRVMTNLTTATDPVALQAIVDNTRRATANLAEASKGVVGMIGETRAELASSLASVRSTATTAQSVLESVRGAAQSAQAVLDKQVAGLVDNANALVGDLRGVVHGNEAVLQATAADMRQASRSLKELAREVREKPSRLLFSGTQPDRKLP
jgi:phospholipid/cholesterol/gamma-HCH transport system substrate-binding protein